jgi:hypothetical protein
MTRAAHVFLLCAFTTSLCGCDYFKPAQPEAPSNLHTFIPNYTDPDSTLSTIAKSIADKGITIGGSAYADAFANPATTGSLGGYHQIFDHGDVVSWEQASGRSAPADWGFDLEQSFYNRFVRLRPDRFVCTWALDPPNPDSGGTNLSQIKISRHYLIVSQASDGQQTSFLAIGFADLYMLRFPDGAWRILLWKDRRDPDANSADKVTLGFQRMDTAP